MFIMVAMKITLLAVMKIYHLISCAKDVVDDLAGVCLEVTSCKFLTKEKGLMIKMFLMSKIFYIWYIWCSTFEVVCCKFMIDIYSYCWVCITALKNKHIFLAKSVFATFVVNQKPYLNSDKVWPKLPTNNVKNLFCISLKLSYHSKRHVWRKIAMGKGKVFLRKWEKFEQGFWLRRVSSGEMPTI